MDTSPGKILGIGGIFFKSAHRDDLRKWYGEKLGIPQTEWGSLFHWRSKEEPAKDHMTIWSVFPETSDYFAPSSQSFMINYIVDDLEAFLIKLRAAGVKIDPKREDHDYGKFGWIFDSDGNKIELWEPLPK